MVGLRGTVLIGLCVLMCSSLTPLSEQCRLVLVYAFILLTWRGVGDMHHSGSVHGE